MPGYRKLGRSSDQRKALLRNLTSNLIYFGKIKTTEARAKEVRKMVEHLITISKKVCKDFQVENVDVTTYKRDANGKKIKEVVGGKKVDVTEIENKKVMNDGPARLNARRTMLSVFYPIKERPDSKKKKKLVMVDLPRKMFEVIAPKYSERNGGYTRILKLGKRKGDAADMVLLELL
jgi:large subunit ribosomal protein L17